MVPIISTIIGWERALMNMLDENEYFLAYYPLNFFYRLFVISPLNFSWHCYS